MDDFTDLSALFISACVVVFFMTMAYYDTIIRTFLLIILGIFIGAWAFSNIRIK